MSRTTLDRRHASSGSASWYELDRVELSVNEVMKIPGSPFAAPSDLLHPITVYQSAMADHVQRSTMFAQCFQDISRGQDDEIRRRADFQRVVFYIHGTCRALRDHVVQGVQLSLGRCPAQVRSQKRHLEHVVTSERIVGIRDVILSETNVHAFVQKLFDARVEWSRMRVAHDC